MEGQKYTFQTLVLDLENFRCQIFHVAFVQKAHFRQPDVEILSS